MFGNLTPDKEKKIKIGCLIVICLLVPAFVVYYEYNIAAANNIDQMKKHAVIEQPISQTNIPNMTKTNTNGP